jgi:hypothetical protein
MARSPRRRLRAGGRRRPTCVVQSEGLSFTTKSTNFHEWGAASLEIFGFGFIRVDS